MTSSIIVSRLDDVERERRRGSRSRSQMRIRVDKMR